MKLKKIVSLRQELETATQEFNIGKIRKLFKSGLNFNFSFSQHSNRTPLQSLLIRQITDAELQFIKELLTLGVDVNFANERGEHSLFYVQTKEQVDLLLSFKVNIFLKNENGILAFSSSHIDEPEVKRHIIYYAQIIEEKKKFENMIEQQHSEKKVHKIKI